jgi:tyrosyl-tRNA synthetase
LIAQITDQEELGARLAAGGLTYYCGFDPSAPSLHIGNLVQLLTMRRLQIAGNRPLALVGGATGLIGDPKMRGERPLQDESQVRDWVDKIRPQVGAFLDFEGPHAAQIVNNLDWTKDISAIGLLRDIGRHYRMSTMLAKETVSRRLASAEGLSYSEFSYQILQGLDFLELHRRYDCMLQSGGNDQWGNLLSGVELIHKVEQTRVYAFTTPLVTKADGTKFGKTESGTIWLDPAMTSPYAFYQFWLNTDDRDVIDFLKFFTFRDAEEIAQAQEQVATKPEARAAARTLAMDVTALVHGEGNAQAARAASAALFGQGELSDVDQATLEQAVAELPREVVGPTQAVSVVEVLASTGLERGLGAARRTIASGGVSVNNRKVTDPAKVLEPEDFLHGRYALVRRGRKTLAVVERRAG